jgi:hypothetical protein
MDDRFLQYCNQLQPKLDILLGMDAVHPIVSPANMPQRGVYLLTENDVHVYTGRSNNMPRRLRDHCSGSYRKAALASELARLATDNEPTYRAEGSITDLMSQPEFVAAFDDARNRIRNMTLRYVEDTDSVRQCLLEIYVSIVLGTIYNSWDNAERHRCLLTRLSETTPLVGAGNLQRHPAPKLRCR